MSTACAIAAPTPRGDHHGHLGAAEPEHGAAHRHELRQAELEPHGEHEEDHAELREVALVFGRGNEAEGFRADERAHDEVAEDRGHGKLAEEHHHGDRGGEQDQGHRQGVVH